MDYSDSSDISNKLSEMKFKSPKKHRRPLHEKGNSVYPIRQHTKDYTNMGDYTFHDRNYIRGHIEPKTSKYNGLRVFSEKQADAVDEDSYSEERNIERQFDGRNSWNKIRKDDERPRRNKDEIDRDTFYNRSKHKSVDSNRRFKENKQNEFGYREEKKLSRNISDSRKNKDAVFEDKAHGFDDSIDFEDQRTLLQLQKELDSLKKKQQKIISSKESTLGIITREVEQSRREFEREKEQAIESLTNKYEDQLRDKERSFRDFKDKTKDVIVQYKEACIKKIKSERNDYQTRINLLKNDCEERVKKYKTAYMTLRDKYKHDILSLYKDR